jgi:hypothetical protein
MVDWLFLPFPLSSPRLLIGSTADGVRAVSDVLIPIERKATAVVTAG